jgi:hypothetical protein
MTEEEYLRHNYGECLLGDGCHCVRNLGNWMGAVCAQWEPTKAKTFVELMEAARADRAKQKALRDGAA